jgi:hypothetical protein
VGGIGVVVTLAYLAARVKGNKHALQSNTYQSLRAESSQSFIAVTSNPEPANVIVKGV